jgi:hypothetical protein
LFIEGVLRNSYAAPAAAVNEEALLNDPVFRTLAAIVNAMQANNCPGAHATKAQAALEMIGKAGGWIGVSSNSYFAMAPRLKGGNEEMWRGADVRPSSRRHGARA